MMNIDKGTIVRIVIFVLAWVNNILAAKGMKTIPVLDDQTIATIITILITAYTFYKDNFKNKGVLNDIVKETESVVEKVYDSSTKSWIESKQAKPAPVVVPVAPSNQPISPAPVAQPEQVQPATPVQENK